MQTSTEVKEITKALLGFHKDVSNIPKTATNPFFKSKYADLSTILTNINEPLLKNGLVLSQFPEGESGLTTRLMHISGEWMESTYIMKPVKATPQDAGSAITYQRRYAIGAILSLNIDEDDDGNKASKEPVYPKVTEKKTNGLVKQPEPLLPEEQKIVDRIYNDIEACDSQEALVSLFNKEKGLINSIPVLFKAKERKKKELA